MGIAGGGMVRIYLTLSLLFYGGVLFSAGRPKCPAYEGVAPPSARLGLEGIRFFENLDRDPRKVYESGTPGEPGYLRAEYRPTTGEYLFLKITGKDPEGHLETTDWHYNERTGALYSSGGNSDDLGLPAKFAAEKSVFAKKLGHAIPKEVLGFPEAQAILSSVTLSKPTTPEKLKQGDFILFLDADNHYSASVVQLDKVSGDQALGPAADWLEFRSSPLLGGQKMDLHLGRDGELSGISSDFGEAGEGRPVGYRRISDNLQIWKLTAAQAEQFAKHRSIKDDPLAGLAETREGFTAYVTLQHLQYMRWGKDHIGYHSDGDPAHKRELKAAYAEVTPENYARAIEILISRVGEDAFAMAAEKLMDRHLHTLHTKLHMPESPFEPHSDVGTHTNLLATLAREAVQDVHPIPEAMSEAGHVANVNPLFSDKDFWSAMQSSHPVLFNRFVDHIKGLPRDYLQRGSVYGVRARIDPVALIKQYFPKAFGVIHRERPDFDSDTKEAIRIVPREPK
jgi:hypothetical protein